MAAVPRPYDWNATPPMDTRAAFIEWMQANRGEDPEYLGQRWDRFQALIANKDIWGDRNKRAFLLTPREEFVHQGEPRPGLRVAFLDIGYGVTISGPHLVGAHDQFASTCSCGEKVLEIGTGSGYQSAYLANLTDKVCTIEIIKPLAERTRGVYDD